MEKTLLWFTCCLGLFVTACFSDPADTAAPEKKGDDAKRVTDALEGIHIDRDAKTVDVDATVINPTEEWLELLVCTRNSREHESLMVVDAKPSDIHLALLLLEMKPGKPLAVEESLVFAYGLDSKNPLALERTWPKFISIPAEGPSVAVSILVETDGKVVETPANKWLVSHDKNAPMKNNLWMFTGSMFYKDDQGKEHYLADINGNVISLVHFGDDLLARDNQHQGGEGGGSGLFSANMEKGVIPKAGTKVKIRLRPMKEVKGE